MAEINTTLNDVFKSTPLGDVKSSIGNNLFGINHRHTPNRVPINRDHYGYTFFTRPMLNLTNQNLRSIREFSPLLTTNELSLPRMIRNYLDPRLNLPCPISDNKSAFIPFLSNMLLSCTGWPDPFVEVHTSKPGRAREVYSLVDSVIDRNSAYDISATFRNMDGDPITAMFYLWIYYSSLVFEGLLVPYPDMIAYREIDYQTRIWRLVMDKNKRIVQKIASADACFPKNSPLGGSFNFESDRPINPTNDQISIQFHCIGYTYNDPILVWEFNRVVAMFNPEMELSNLKNMFKLNQYELSLFNTTACYPNIDPNTMELNWYVSPDLYQSVISAYNRNIDALAGTGASNNFSSLYVGD